MAYKLIVTGRADELYHNYILCTVQVFNFPKRDSNIIPYGTVQVTGLQTIVFIQYI